ncbi:unnamed protein product [Allacma fusca]|uniref:Uncharacterized protein n=1 Tax=Allacma fusca TaxID=39272 RepID=A0A8J2L7N7_9HEXA|nr:unnamed protein product [Allacma fusca]
MRNGSWNGLLGALADSRLDIAAWLGNTEARNPYGDFTTAAVNIPLVFFTSLPRAAVKWYGMFFVFSNETKSPMYLDIKKGMKYLPRSSMTQSMMKTALESKTVQLEYDLIGQIIIAESLTIHPTFIPVKMSRTPLFDLPVSFVLRKYSKLTETVTVNVGKLQNTGHFKKWFDQSLDAIRSRGMSWLKNVKAV